MIDGRACGAGCVLRCNDTHRLTARAFASGVVERVLDIFDGCNVTGLGQTLRERDRHTLTAGSRGGPARSPSTASRSVRWRRRDRSEPTTDPMTGAYSAPEAPPVNRCSGRRRRSDLRKSRPIVGKTLLQLPVRQLVGSLAAQVGQARGVQRAARSGAQASSAGERGLDDLGSAGAPTRSQQSNTDQQMSFRNRWSSSTSSRIASGSWSRCHRHSSCAALSPSPSGAAARAALIA
jgi:hypothetical protein